MCGILKSMTLVAFAFKGNISSRVLQKLEIKDKTYLLSNYKEIEDFVDKLTKTNPRYILGLGMYSGKDKDKLRIETHYNNDKEKKNINFFLSPGNQTKLAQGIGNSYCNFVSANIMKAIEDIKLNAQYTFIHIPKSFDVNYATEEIEFMLQDSDKDFFN